jgi:DNA repair protein RecN (Recombination protein N)
MLLGLTIRDVVLIDRLDLAFHPGLSVLTGETGAGKSILLDSLGLALGARADAGLVRAGAAQAVVTAEFQPPRDHATWALLGDQGLDAEETIVLRRIVGADGRSRAFVNDQPASVGLLRQIGETLVEIQGQHEQRGLLDPATHRGLLDAFGNHRALLEEVRSAWRSWREVHEARQTAEAELQAARRDEDYLRHAMAELDAIDPQPGEEDELANQRALLMHRERLVAAVNAAFADLNGERGADRGLNAAARTLERVRDKAFGQLEPVLAAVERAIVETTEAIAQLQVVSAAFDVTPQGLEKIEERLFALRALARKHGITVEELPPLRSSLAARLGRLDDSGSALAGLAQREVEARAVYAKRAQALSAERRRAATALDRALLAELAPLKLDRARFHTAVTVMGEADWGPDGTDRVAFEVATNPGSAPGPLARIASGGELSRFMLALKVVLARLSPVETLVFDEVDSGIGGAVAAAVGERLQRLGEERQILVVTHSPQVAARGTHHWRVAKSAGANSTLTRVEKLDETARREEIARMLSGASVTEEARSAARSLLTAGGHA